MDHSYHHWTIRTVDDSYRHSIISVNSVKATPQKVKNTTPTQGLHCAVI